MQFRKGTKVGKAYNMLLKTFGTETGFRFARLCKGCIIHGQYWKRGDPLVEMDKSTFDHLQGVGALKESKAVSGSFYMQV